MKQVAVIGGGFAGLAAAVALAERGIGVTVLEARARLGGRAYSFRDEASGSIVDNGQHAMMGCYGETLRFLDRIAALPKLMRQTDLRVDMVDVGRGAGAIASLPIPAPLHMLGAVLRYRLLSPRERLRALTGGVRLLAMRRRGDERLVNGTVAGVLRQLGQSANACASFWYPVAIATLNEVPEDAAAGPFAEVVARAFFGSRADSQFVLPAVGLSDLYTDGARGFVERRGGRVECKAMVASMTLRDERVTGVVLRDGRHVAVDACVSAVPPQAMAGFAPAETAAAGTGFAHSPIVSVHLWYDRPVLRTPFVGLLGTTTQWLFDRSTIVRDGKGDGAGDGGQCVSAVVSADRTLASWDVARIGARVADDVRRVLPAARPARLLHHVVVKEKQATIATTPAAMRRRPAAGTSIPNLVLAGDWTATGLPPTIESAVLSGHRAAELVAARLQA